MLQEQQRQDEARRQEEEDRLRQEEEDRLRQEAEGQSPAASAPPVGSEGSTTA